jgi:hypothetical protein
MACQEVYSAFQAQYSPTHLSSAMETPAASFQRASNSATKASRALAVSKLYTQPTSSGLFALLKSNGRMLTARMHKTVSYAHEFAPVQDYQLLHSQTETCYCTSDYVGATIFHCHAVTAHGIKWNHSKSKRLPSNVLFPDRPEWV